MDVAVLRCCGAAVLPWYGLSQDASHEWHACGGGWGKVRDIEAEAKAE